MKILFDIILEQIDDQIKLLKTLVDKESKKSWLIYNRSHMKYLAQLWDRIKSLKQVKKTFIFNMKEIQILMEMPVPFEKEEVKTNRNFD